MTDFANVAAATAAGYAYQSWQDNDGLYVSRLTKVTRGASGEGDAKLEATSSGRDQTTADTNVVSALNAQRSARYGFGEPAVASLDDEGGSQVVDQT